MRRLRSVLAFLFPPPFVAVRRETSDRVETFLTGLSVSVSYWDALRGRCRRATEREG